jgi:hypothetical protein
MKPDLPGDWSDTDTVLTWPQVVSVLMIYAASIAISVCVIIAQWQAFAVIVTVFVAWNIFVLAWEYWR